MLSQRKYFLRRGLLIFLFLYIFQKKTVGVKTVPDFSVVMIDDKMR